VAKTLQLRRYPTATLNQTIGLQGELIVDTDKHTITVHDGFVNGGYTTLGLPDLNAANTWLQANDFITLTAAKANTGAGLNAANTWLQANDFITLTAAKAYIDSGLNAANTWLQANDFITLTAEKANTGAGLNAANTWLQANDFITLTAAKAYTDVGLATTVNTSGTQSVGGTKTFTNQIVANGLKSTLPIEIYNQSGSPQFRMRDAPTGSISFYDSISTNGGIYNYSMTMDNAQFNWSFSNVNTAYDTGTSKMMLDSSGNLTIGGSISGSGTGLTGTAASLTAGYATQLISNGNQSANTITANTYYQYNSQGGFIYLGDDYTGETTPDTSLRIPEIRMGHKSIATEAALEFWTSGGATVPSGYIKVTGGDGISNSSATFSILGNLNVTGSFTGAGSHTITGNQAITGNLSIGGNETINGNLTVTGTTTSATYYGAGTGLTGTAASLTCGTANALNPANDYTGKSFSTNQLNVMGGSDVFITLLKEGIGNSAYAKIMMGRKLKPASAIFEFWTSGGASWDSLLYASGGTGVNNSGLVSIGGNFSVSGSISGSGTGLTGTAPLFIAGYANALNTGNDYTGNSFSAAQFNQDDGYGAFITLATDYFPANPANTPEIRIGHFTHPTTTAFEFWTAGNPVTPSAYISVAGGNATGTTHGTGTVTITGNLSVTGSVNIPGIFGAPAQTYHNVKTSRAFGGVYTNNHATAIFANVRVSSLDLDYDDPYIWSKATVDGEVISHVESMRGSSGQMTHSFFVPVGSTYHVDIYCADEPVNQLSYGQTIEGWMEYY